MFRASGDGWNPDEYDRDYDDTNDVIMMMLHDRDDVDEQSNEGGETPVESDEEIEVLHRIILVGSVDKYTSA